MSYITSHQQCNRAASYRLTYVNHPPHGAIVQCTWLQHDYITSCVTSAHDRPTDRRLQNCLSTADNECMLQQSMPLTRGYWQTHPDKSPLGSILCDW